MSEIANEENDGATTLPAVANLDLSFFGAPPLLPGEDPLAYNKMLTAVTDTVKPADFFEAAWVRDIVNLEWDIIRYRNFSAKIVKMRYDYAFPYIPRKTPEQHDIPGIVVANIDILARLDQMVMTMEARRNAACREIDRHRTGFGERIRRAAEEIVDGEYREVDDNSVERKHAA